jgi:hypothetical protein
LVFQFSDDDCTEIISLAALPVSVQG